MATGKIYEIKEIKTDILKSNPPQLSITAKGTTRTNGWENGQLIPRFNPSHPAIGGIYEFDFVANVPTGITLQVISPIAANFVLTTIPQDLKKIIVYAETNNLEKSFATIPTMHPVVEQLRESTGYSENMNFDEAFSNAIHNLPAKVPSSPDALESIHVVEIGALFGGFAGISKMYVKIQSNQ